MRTDPAVAELRRVVRSALVGLPEPVRSAPVLVACSGGADSLALAAAVAELRHDAHAAVVDHGLQDGSAQVAREAAEQLSRLGLAAGVHRVEVGGPGGPEAAARRARYAALAAARPHPDSAVLLGHTLDDQAETVLLGLGRGSGPRSLAGMRAWDAPWCRPLLGIRRATTRAACAALGLPVWDDPHNEDPRFTRVRLRREVLPLLEDVLAGGVTVALARTAEQLREDGDLLDALAADLLTAALSDADAEVERLGAEPAAPGSGPHGSVGRISRLGVPDLPTRGAGSPDSACRIPRLGMPDSTARGAGSPDPADRSAPPGGPRVAVLAAAPAALRRRALRSWLVGEGVAGLTDAHLRAADRLLTGRPGVASVALPGGLELARAHERVVLRPVAWPAPGPRGRAEPESGVRVRRANAVYDGDIASVLVTEQAIRDKTAELAERISRDYADITPAHSDLILVGVLKGAVMFMTDLARALPVPVQLEFMAVSSYGSATSSSGVVRILKDLDRDIAGRHVLIVEDIIDSGLTLSWLLKNLESRSPASLRVVTLLRKPDAVKVDVPVAYVGFDIPNEFVVGYGLDYAERYRDLPFIGTLAPAVYA